jgi:3-oxoacyl-[acyl-carrier-protein] synthase II
MQFKRIVITGIGAVTPIGNTLETYWNNLVAGVSGAAPITLFDASKFKTRFACEAKNFDPHIYIDKKDARKLDRYTQLSIAAADQAVFDSGMQVDQLNKNRVGVIFGSGIGGFGTFQNEVFDFAKGDGTPRFTPFFIPKLIPDIAAGHISIKYGFLGPNFCVSSACATSTNSIIEAVYHMRLGKADVMITGGGEAAIGFAGVGGFNALRALSERNDSPETASRPYDKDRDGFVLGEGAGALVLETLEHALERGARIYAEIGGCGASADAYHITAPHPEGLGAKNVMNLTLEDAVMTPADIDYINAHGTSTELGDLAEVKAIAEVFGTYLDSINISSTKSMTGHCLGAAGVLEAIACIKSVQEDIVPPTINHFTNDSAFDSHINFTFNKAQKRTVRAALSNNFGFGGHNACIIVKKYSN